MPRGTSSRGNAVGWGASLAWSIKTSGGRCAPAREKSHPAPFRQASCLPAWWGERSFSPPPDPPSFISSLFRQKRNAIHANAGPGRVRPAAPLVGGGIGRARARPAAPPRWAVRQSPRPSPARRRPGGRPRRRPGGGMVRTPPAGPQPRAPAAIAVPCPALRPSVRPVTCRFQASHPRFSRGKWPFCRILGFHRPGVLWYNGGSRAGSSGPEKQWPRECW